MMKIKVLTSRLSRLWRPMDRSLRPVSSPSSGRSAPWASHSFVYLYLCTCICVFVFVHLYLCICIWYNHNLHPVGALLSEASSAPWDFLLSKVHFCLTKCWKLWHLSCIVMAKIFKTKSEANAKRRHWYLSDRISARHFVPSTFLKIRSKDHLSECQTSPPECCRSEKASWMTEVFHIVCCLVWSNGHLSYPDHMMKVHIKQSLQWWWHCPNSKMWKIFCDWKPWLDLRLCSIWPHPQWQSPSPERAPSYDDTVNFIFIVNMLMVIFINDSSSSSLSSSSWTSWGGTSNDTVLRSTFL